MKLRVGAPTPARPKDPRSAHTHSHSQIQPDTVSDLHTNALTNARHLLAQSDKVRLIMFALPTTDTLCCASLFQRRAL